MRYVLFLVLLLSSGVFAASGVSPSSYSIEFEPLYSDVFNFDFIFDDNSMAELYVEGDLAEYVSLDQDNLRGGGRVVASLDLPLSIERPGTHYIFIGARQLPKGDGGFNLISDVRGIIKVEVPYEGKYIELDLIAYDANVGEMANLKVISINRGDEALNFTPLVQIFKGNNLIESVSLNETYLLPRQSEEHFLQINTSGYSAGNYSAVAITDFGGERPSKGDDSFRLGEYGVRIINHTKKLVGGGLEPFVIDVENLYNGVIENVYAKVNLVDLDVEGFITPEVTLRPFGRARLEGYFDSSVFLDGEFSVEIILHYGDEQESKPGLLFLQKPVRYFNYILYGLIGVFLLFVLWRFILFLKRMRV